MTNKSILFGAFLALLVISCKTKTPQEQQQRLPVAQIQRDTSLFKDYEAVAPVATQLAVDDTISYFDENFLRYDNHIYKPNIKTVLFHRKGWEMSRPLIEMGSNSRLKLSFDDLDGGFKNYEYTIIHCNSDWQPSPINQQEYIDGFTSDFITEYKTSINTLQKYTHYTLTFPGNNVRPRLSGNYILKVYLDSPDNVVLTQRFKIFEQKVTIEGRVRQATVIEDRDYRQEVVFKIQHPEYRILNPYQNLKVVLQQNERTDNKIKNLQPSLVRNNELLYEYEMGNVFDGNNEFRAFDIKNLQLAMEGVERIQLRDGQYYVFLTTDQRRSYRRYRQRPDINGRRLINREGARDSSTEAEYAHVHFTLAYPAPLIHGHVYIMGALTNWGFTEEAKMIYNYKTKAYEKSLYIKQGYYNYTYAFLENGKDAADLGFIEGTHSQTENDYAIFVYYKEPNIFYDKLVGVKFLNTRE